jgi:hypothetical protein
VCKAANSYMIHQPKRFREAGVEVALLDRDAALQLCQDRLGLARIPPVLMAAATPAPKPAPDATLF